MPNAYAKTLEAVLVALPATGSKRDKQARAALRAAADVLTAGGSESRALTAAGTAVNRHE